MKVISRVEYKDWTHRVVCKKCMSEIEVYPDDVKCSFNGGHCDMREPREYRVYHVHCPICGEQCNIPVDSIPITLQIAVQDRTPSDE